MKKRTLGPWVYDGQSPSVYDGNGRVATCCKGAAGAPRADWEGNCRLIAAASELLAACKAVVAAWEAGDLAAAARMCQAASDKAK